METVGRSAAGARAEDTRRPDREAVRVCGGVRWLILFALLGFALSACSGGSSGPRATALAVTGIPLLALSAGQTAQLRAMLAFDDGSQKDVTATAAWSSSDTRVVSVSATGVLSANGAGSAEIIAEAQGASSRAAIRITQGPARLDLLAGNFGGAGYVDAIGADARFSNPHDVIFDDAGSVLVTQSFTGLIRKIAPTGEVSTFAGSHRERAIVDGRLSEARFASPSGLALDRAGNIYVADEQVIRRITRDGVVSTIAGMPGQAGSTDGAGAVARFNRPDGIAVDAAGNVYVADSGNFTIRAISASGIVTTIAGAAGMIGSDDGVGSAARFGGCPGSLGVICRGPSGIAIDNAGNIYVADAGNYTVRKIDPARVVTTLAGGGPFGQDGTGPAAGFGGCFRPGGGPPPSCEGPADVAVDTAGNVYVADPLANTVRKITAAGVVTTLAGSYSMAGSADAQGAQARFFQPRGIAVDGAGSIVVADTGNHLIRSLTPTAETSTLAGAIAQYGNTDGAGPQARFGNCFPSSGCFGPAGVATDAAGNAYVAYGYNAAIRKVTPAGVVTTVAASASGLARPTGVALDQRGDVYVADPSRQAIFRISPEGAVTIVAGAPGQIGSADGVGNAARFNCPTSLAIDGSGTLYVVDACNSSLRKITADGRVTTLAGGTSGSADGIGSAASFRFGQINTFPAFALFRVSGVAVDRDGNVFVADTENHTLRRISPAGVVTTLAGAAGQSGSADGPGSSARFFWPEGLVIDGAGNLCVVDANATVRKVSPTGEVITVIGRAGQVGFVPGASPGGLALPNGLAIDASRLIVTMDHGVAVVSNVP